MGALDAYASQVAAGATVSLRPAGSSMLPLIRSRQLVTVEPVESSTVEVGDIVLARVKGVTYLHLVSAVDKTRKRVQIGNNRGRVDGWTDYVRLYGLCTSIDGSAATKYRRQTTNRRHLTISRPMRQPAMSVVSGPGKQQGSGATFSSERSERLGKRCEPQAVAGPCASGPPVYDRKPERQKGTSLSSVAPQALPSICSGVGLRNPFRPRSPT
jgi:hypothetical protein